MRKFILLLGVAAMLAGCGFFSAVTEGLVQAKAVETDLEQSTGVKPAVGYNWHNGRLTSVTVQFPHLYADKPLGDLAGLARNAVTKEFKQTPERIVLAFVLDK